jgi:hypothetical protein
VLSYLPFLLNQNMNLERLKSLLEIPFEALAASKDLKAELTEYYKYIFDAKGCSTCKDKFPIYYKKLKESGVEKLTVLTTGNFKMRANIGVMEISFGNGQFISQTNASDEVCIEFLKANPNRISLFEKFPENWKELIQDNEIENEND